MSKATNAANYIFWLEQLQPSIRDTDENRERGPENFKSLELDNLQFSYPMRPNARVLRGIDLDVCHPSLYSTLILRVTLTSCTDQRRTIRRVRRSIGVRKEHHDQHARAVLRPNIWPHQG